MTQLKPDLAAAKERVEAWWRGENAGRPIIEVTSPSAGSTPYIGPATDDMDAWWTDPDYVIPRMEHQLKSTYYGGEAMPVIFPVATTLVSITNKFLGARNVYVDRNTTWNAPLLSDWSTRPTFQFDPDNIWWQRAERLLTAGVTLMREKGLEAFVGLPDLNGPTEVLSGLRGPQEFALDFYDNRSLIGPALREVQDAWTEAYHRSTAIAHQCGGYFCWMGIWSDRPMTDLQSDVSCLISREMFDEEFLPFIREQADTIDRTIYHLDGPDAIRHLDSLLGIDSLDGIQWVQGAGAGRMSEWIDLVKRIQDAGKLVFAMCDPDEVVPLCRALDPQGLNLVTKADSPAAADQLLLAAEAACRTK
ncbi:MAG: hypothetical protein E4H09_00470 [Spirochaetales bacterium]|nr:MAG: hypothetical protein E4H09_00470 [Spirochaetales bacterium]